MQSFSPEELTRKHLSTKMKAKDRARDFSDDLYEDGSILFLQSVIQSTIFGVKLLWNIFGRSDITPIPEFRRFSVRITAENVLIPKGGPAQYGNHWRSSFRTRHFSDSLNLPTSYDILFHLSSPAWLCSSAASQSGQSV